METATWARAVLAPGYGGGPEQRILRLIEEQLALDGFACALIAFGTQGRRPSKGYEAELADLRRAHDGIRARHPGPLALVGRSFGGHICTFLAAKEPPGALAILGYPIAPMERPRPGDEAALLALTCPTRIVQGDRDGVGPLNVIERIAAANPRITPAVIPGAGHGYGKQEGAAIEAWATWLNKIL